MTMDKTLRLAQRLCAPDEVRDLLADGDAGDVGVRPDHVRHDGGVGHAQPREPVDHRVLIHDRVWLSVVEEYHGQHFEPTLTIGDRTVLGRDTYISCVGQIDIEHVERRAGMDLWDWAFRKSCGRGTKRDQKELSPLHLSVSLCLVIRPILD